MANPIVILQWNCDGLKAKRLELDTLIAEYSPRVICLQETMLDPSIERSQNDPTKYLVLLKLKAKKPILNVFHQVVMALQSMSKITPFTLV